MSHRVIGVGVEPLDYSEESLALAAYLARKMADNGVEDIRVFDSEGRQLSDVELANAPLPPGWTKHP